MSIASSNTTERVVLTPSQLNGEIRHALERGFPALWVEGEISNLARPSSGHLYFSLKDARSQIRCAMFRNRNMLLSFTPANGQQVLARARISVYEPRGEYQLIVEHMEEAGFGALQRAFEALKAKLQAEGLFDESRKRPIPAAPQRIGVITSPTGAALRDILTTLRRRYPAAEVILYPSAVQGADAPAQLIRALKAAARRAETDVLILARGGGSLEDLMAFNDEAVARAVAASPIPVVCGVGHEVDFSIADFVADLRAPTPTGAAELVTPDGRDILRRLEQLQSRQQRALQQKLTGHTERLRWLRGRMQQQHPGQRLRQQSQRLDELEQRLERVTSAGLHHRRMTLARAMAGLRERTPLHRLARSNDRLENLSHRLLRAWREQLNGKEQALAYLGRALHTVSPLATLGRGYAIVSKADGGIARNAADVAPGERITARLAKGSLIAEVLETKKE